MSEIKQISPDVVDAKFTDAIDTLVDLSNMYYELETEKILLTLEILSNTINSLKKEFNA